MVPTPGGHSAGCGAGAYASAERVMGTPYTGLAPATSVPGVSSAPFSATSSHSARLLSCSNMSACYAGKEDWASALAEAVAVVKLKPDWPKAPMQSTHHVTDCIRRGVTGGGRCHCHLVCVALQGYFRMAQALIKLDRNIEVTLQRAVAASCMPCRGMPPSLAHGARRSHRLGVVATWGSCSTTPTR